MGLLDKLEQVEIKADSRLPEDDLMFCETQQQAYDESCRALREIRQQWKKAIQAQRDLLGIEENELAAAIDRFLYAKPKLNRNIFVRRYYHLYAIRDIADAYGMSESKVTSLLFRMRNELRRFLEKEGIML